jgi:hypothetical protein
MGFDGLISFLIRNLPNDTFDEIHLTKNHTKIVSKHILIDISFILYNCYIEIEEDINKILKYIYSLSCTDYNMIIKKIENELKKNHWKDFNVPLDGETQDEISDKFINYLMENDNKVFFELLSKYTSKKLETILDNLFELKFTGDVILFFDSIPSYSKILEQRKRRIKNYMESQNRKQYYVKYFTDLENCNVIEDNIEYDYFSWMNKKFSCNKIIDSNSSFVKHLKEYILTKINISKHINIKIDEEEFGEADYKIFKYISSNNLKDKITILSCDSDLVYQLILQQYNYNYCDLDVELGLFKFYVNSFEYCQYFDANKIIKYLKNIYNEVNGIKVNKENNFCLDFLFLLNFFGNDFLPSSLEIGPEISFHYLLKTYHKVFSNLSKGIINPNYDSKNKLYYKIDFDNLKKWLGEINKCSSFTKIILLRYYNLPYYITQILTDKLGLNLKEIKEQILIPYLTYKGMVNNDNLEENDIRRILYKKHMKETPDKEIVNPLENDNYPASIKPQILSLDELFENYLDYMDYNNLGLKNNKYNIEYNENMYENLYNYITYESYLENTTYDINFDFELEEPNKHKTESYLRMMYFIVKNFFNDMEYYHSTNLTRYDFDTTPSIMDIINFISSNDMNNITLEFDKVIESEILPKESYIDSTLHHLIITPYLLDSSYLDMLENKNLLRTIINNFNFTLSKIWCKDNNDTFKKEDPILLLKEWSNLIHGLNSQLKLENKNNLLIEV